MEKLGAGSRSERIQTLAEPALELVRRTGSRLRRTVARVSTVSDAHPRHRGPLVTIRQSSAGPGNRPT